MLFICCNNCYVSKLCTFLYAAVLKLTHFMDEVLNYVKCLEGLPVFLLVLKCKNLFEVITRREVKPATTGSSLALFT